MSQSLREKELQLVKLISALANQYGDNIDRTPFKDELRRARRDALMMALIFGKVSVMGGSSSINDGRGYNVIMYDERSNRVHVAHYSDVFGSNIDEEAWLSAKKYEVAAKATKLLAAFSIPACIALNYFLR